MVGCEFVLGACDLDGVDGATDVRAAGRSIDGAACGIAVGGGIGLGGTRTGVADDRGADFRKDAILPGWRVRCPGVGGRDGERKNDERGLNLHGALPASTAD